MPKLQRGRLDMKLCPKCIDAILSVSPNTDIPESWTVKQSDCEFWAHHKLNDFDELEYGKGYLDHSHNSQTRKGGDMGR